MVNKNYQKGYRKERNFVTKAREEGKIAFRSSGSHSKIDVCIIDLKNKKIEMIQSKNKKIYGKEKIDKKEFEANTDEYFVEFKYLANDKKQKKRLV